MSCGVGGRHGSDPTCLWLWLRSAAIALIQPLAWEPPHAAGVALKRQDKKINTFPKAIAAIEGDSSYGSGQPNQVN